MFPQLETERLQLVELDDSYIQSYFDIMSNEEVTRYYGMDPLQTQADAENIIHSFADAFKKRSAIRWGLVLKDSSDLIGTIGLNALQLKSKKANVGYEIHPFYWRRGLMKEAMQAIMAFSFEGLGLVRLGAVTFIQNEASNQLLMKAGFQQEGVLRSYLFQNERNHDAFSFSLLHNEWRHLYGKEDM
ncbi:GNAT family N-acetyltransferase [Bacillus sp. 1P06AnD]|uniref:GNAT family N-acetyltransferase n=1 Tax=Bacillus sp. 1P06AnD TaxID=3132208 RepID=UPI0039A050E7